MDKKRIFFLDFLRAIAIFFIIWCHTNNIEYSSILFEKIKWFLGKCGVPIFFMLSGYLAFPFNGNIKQYFQKKVRRILIPFIIWVLIYDLVALNKGYELFLGDLLNEASAHLWFIYIIIGLYLLVPILSPFLQNCSRSVFKFYLVIWGLTTIYPLIFSVCDIHFTEHNILYTLYYFYGFIGYFIVGYYLKRFPDTRLLKRSISVFFLLLSSILIGIYFYVFNCHTVEVSDYKGLPIVLYSIAFFTIFKYLSSFVKNSFFEKIATSVSVNSFGIYLVHMLVVIYIYPFIPILHNIPSLLVTLYFVLINLLLSYVFVFILKKIKYSNYLLG